MSTLEVTTVIGCSLSCTFCPQDKLIANYGKESKTILHLDTFKTCLGKLPSHVGIAFSGFSEPFLNPNCTNFIKETIKYGNPIYIYTTLVGLKRNQVDYLEKLLMEGRFDIFKVHLPDDSSNMRGFRLNDDYLYAVNKILSQKNVSVMTMSSNARIDKSLYKEISQLSRATEILNKVKNLSPFKGHNRAGSLSKIALRLLKKKSEDVVQANWECGITCSKTPFYDRNVLLPDGRVVLCCMDYGLKHVLGNLLIQSYYELFESNELNKIRAANMSLGSDFKKDSLCSSCSVACEWDQKKGGIWVTQDNLSGASTKKLLSTFFNRVKYRLRVASKAKKK